FLAVRRHARLAKSRRHVRSGHRRIDREDHRRRHACQLDDGLPRARPGDPLGPLLGAALVQARPLARLLGRVHPPRDETALRTRRARDLVVWSGKDHQDGSVNRAPEVEARGQSPPCDFSAIRARVQPHRLIAAFQVGSVDTPAAFDKRRQYQTTSMLLECDAAYTAQPPAPLESGMQRCPSWHQGEDMALGLAKFGLVLGMALAMAGIILTMTAGLSPSNSRAESTASRALEQPIYRPQHWNLFLRFSKQTPPAMTAQAWATGAKPTSDMKRPGFM